MLQKFWGMKPELKEWLDETGFCQYKEQLFLEFIINKH